MQRRWLKRLVNGCGSAFGPRPYADPDAAARKIANGIEAVQGGRILVEKINAHSFIR